LERYITGDYPALAAKVDESADGQKKEKEPVTELFG
jgi:hypothetical protein